MENEGILRRLDGIGYTAGKNHPSMSGKNLPPFYMQRTYVQTESWEKGSEGKGTEPQLCTIE